MNNVWSKVRELHLLKDAVTFFHLANSHCNIFLMKMVFSFHFKISVILRKEDVDGVLTVG